MRKLFADTALLPEGWRRNVLIGIGDDGTIAAVDADAVCDDAERLAGPVLPGMPNLHSHAFQRALAGLAEQVEDPSDDFWSWRRLMYAFLAEITPDQAEAIAAHLYVEMLKAGYTSVAEFHYLHNAPDGRPYANPAEMAERMAAAAGTAGIGLTLLPVLYRHGGFGQQPLNEHQRRFALSIDRFLDLLEGLPDPCGVAFHSLRAVTLAEMITVLDAVDADLPVHIHVAEQRREVEDCLDWLGAHPIEWLYHHLPVNERWCLIHATHASARELGRMAKLGAVAGLCPTTEANLGDGIFPATAYRDAGGRFGIGSDSHVSVSVIEELRLLEYGQRLSTERRNRLATPAEPSVGGGLYRAAAAGGAQALGQPVGRIALGRRADLVVLDGDTPLLQGCAGDRILDRLIFAGSPTLVRDVMAGGRWRVRDGRHELETRTAAAFAAVMRDLIQRIP